LEESSALGKAKLRKLSGRNLFVESGTEDPLVGVYYATAFANAVA